MGYGDRVDGIFGKLAHVLHVRGTRTDTSRDLERYLDRSLDELFPEPGLPAVARKAPGLLDDPRMESLAWRSGHVPLSDAYKARHEGEYAKNLTAHATWMHPKGTRRRSILLYAHIWLQTTPRLEEPLALPLFSKTMDVDVALVQLPFHGRRNPKGQLFGGEWFWSADLVRSLEAVRQSVYDVRAAMAYFRSIGYEEVGVAGISLGGFVQTLGTWSQQARLIASGAANGDRFAAAVALDGDRALISAPLANNGIGRVNVFERTTALWTAQALLDANNGAPGDRFGWSLAHDGDNAMVGASFTLATCGASYRFRRNGAVWSPVTGSSVAVPRQGNLAGWSVAIDGGRFLVGAPGFNGAAEHRGAGYWFDPIEQIFVDGLDDNTAIECVYVGLEPAGQCPVFELDQWFTLNDIKTAKPEVVSALRRSAIQALLGKLEAESGNLKPKANCTPFKKP